MSEPETLPDDDALRGVHSLLGASGAYRWLACPGSFALSRQAPARPSSIHADRGSLAHWYVEHIHAGWMDGKCALVAEDDEVGRIHQVGRHAIEVDQDFIDGVNLMLAYIHNLERPGTISRIEFRVALDHYFRNASFKPPVRMYGRVDYAVIDLDERTLEIVDFKNGSGILVDPVENPQMLYYAAGVLAALFHDAVPVVADQPHLLPKDFTIERVKLTVVQPHARSPEKIRSWVLDPLDVLMWVDEVLIPGVQACSAPDAPLVSGSWCRFCPAAFACPLLVEEANKMAVHEFSDDGISMPSDPASLGKYLSIAERAETWIKAIRAFAEEQLRSQVQIPGWSLGPTRPVRRWKDEKRVGDLLLEKGVTLDQAFEMSLRSPAQIEKLLKSKGQLWRHSFAPLVESHSSGEKLVHTDIASDFPEE